MEIFWHVNCELFYDRACYKNLELVKSDSNGADVKLRCERQPYLNLCYRINAQMADNVQTKGVAKEGVGDTVVAHGAELLTAAPMV